MKSRQTKAKHKTCSNWREGTFQQKSLNGAVFVSRTQEGSLGKKQERAVGGGRGDEADDTKASAQPLSVAVSFEQQHHGPLTWMPSGQQPGAGAAVRTAVDGPVHSLTAEGVSGAKVKPALVLLHPGSELGSPERKVSGL